jgi:glucosyl-dolichyl phosphate glucuronosyltransferase
VDLTVILCTYNRCDKLVEALGSLALQKVPPEVKWEVLIVDNNSSDKTADVYQKAKSSFPVPLRYVFESKLGLSCARNRGIVEAQGQYVAFTEDDERSDERWVETILETFRRRDCDAVAGKIDLSWRSIRPPWLTDEILGFLGYLDYGDEQPLTEERPPFGGNMAFAKSVFNKIGLFNVDLGRQGRKLVGGDDIELFERFFHAGLIVIYQPKAIAYHIIDKDRLNKSYFRKLHFYEGKISGQQFRIAACKKIAGIPIFVLRQLCRSVASYTSTLYNFGMNQSLRKEMIVWYFVGFIFGCAKQFWVLSRGFRVLFVLGSAGLLGS